MERNIQQPKLGLPSAEARPAVNIQRPRVPHCGGRFGCWTCLAFVLVALPLCAQTATNVLPPLAPAYGEMQPTFGERHGTAIIVACFLLIALIGVIFWMVFRPRPPVTMPPEVLARETLTRLLRQPETGAVLSEISQTLRRYIIPACGLPPGEWTTAEFCAMLADSEKVGVEPAQAISRFLRECDQRKFSPVGSISPLNAAHSALELIDQIELRIRQSMTTTHKSQ